MVLQGDSDTNLKGLRSKKKKMVDNSNRRPWSEHPDALLYMITKLLGTIDYLMFGCVCRAWRLYAVANRQEFMASQPPLVMFMPNRSKRACYFYNIFDEGSIRQNSPTLLAKSFIGSHMVYKRKLYAITTVAGIGVVNLNSCPYVTPLEVKSIPNLKGGLWLRGTDEQFLLINAIGNNHEVYELNFLKMEWVKMQNLGDQALFLDYYKGGLGFSNKTRWKDSETPFNGRYCLDCDNTDIWFHFMDGRRNQSFLFMGRKYCTISFVIREIRQWEPNHTSAECIEDNAEHSEDQTDVQNAECSAQDTG
uniref:KIB1-4 beta-propeller domain-containing protein n=1 Tax=Quercus lobata TaxID=97700 RepID=A0A7N2KZ58_QUELO